MDSYDILNVTRESSDKEIEIAYEDLKRKYDPDFNTSIRAYTKYREVIKAYEDIKNEKRREMYNLKDINENKKINNIEYKLFDFHNIVKEDKEEIIDYTNIEEVEELVKEDIIINKRISYLYYILNLKVDIEYYRNVNCSECTSFIACEECDGKGVVYYKEKQVYCPKCHGKGEISSQCDKCHEEGFYKQKEIISFYVDGEVSNFKDLGNEYYDFTKSNLVVNFDFFDKDNIEVLENVIKVNYYLNKEETKNGLNKEYYGEKGVFKLSVPSFVGDGHVEEIVFNNKKIIFTFYNQKLDGDNKQYYLFINKKYKGQEIYFNENYSNVSLNESEEYFNKLILKDNITLDNLGENGKYGGNSGDLIINCIFNDKKKIFYSDNIVELSTSKIFNLLGGKIGDVKHYGFKGVNSLVNCNDKYYLLKGDSLEKRKLKDYYLFKIVGLVLWVLLPLIAFLIPYSETMFFALFGILIGYFIAINALMEVKL